MKKKRPTSGLLGLLVSEVDVMADNLLAGTEDGKWYIFRLKCGQLPKIYT